MATAEEREVLAHFEEGARAEVRVIENKIRDGKREIALILFDDMIKTREAHNMESGRKVAQSWVIEQAHVNLAKVIDSSNSMHAKRAIIMDKYIAIARKKLKEEGWI